MSRLPQYKPYEYEPLDSCNGSIRLLRLHSSSTPEVTCNLFSAPLFGPGKKQFEALSYTWGSTVEPDKVLIYDKNGTSTLNVTNNLHNALRYLRYEDRDRIIWVDAICINQSDNNEKGHQIAQMRHVYAEATQALIWLGEGNEQTGKIMDSMAWLHSQASLNHVDWKDSKKRRAIAGPLFRQRLEDELATEYTKQVEALQELLSNDWFQRVWILQEAACARAGTIVCGSKSAPAEMLALMHSLFDMEIDENVQAVLEILPGQSRDRSWWAKRTDLHFLMKKFKSCKATNEKDKVFALLGMSSDASQPGLFHPDYDQSLEAVERDTLCFLLLGKVLPPSAIQLPSFPFSELVNYVDNLSPLARRVIDWALPHGHDQTSIILLKEGGYSATGITPLIVSESGGNRGLLQYLLDQDPTSVRLFNRFGETPLNISARKGDETAVSILLGCPHTDINHKDNSGLTPLAVAVIHGHTGIVQLLLGNTEIDVQEGGSLETAPLALSIVLEHPGIEQALSTRQTSGVDRMPKGKALVYLNRRLLAIMARDNDVSGLKRLIEKGVNYDFTDSEGQSPLMHAAMRDSIKTMHILLEEVSQGIVGLDRPDIRGRTALSHAAEMGHMTACMLLMSCSADIDKVDQNNKSPRDWAEDRCVLERTWSMIEELYWSTMGPNAQEIRRVLPTQKALMIGFYGRAYDRAESAQEERILRMALEFQSAAERFFDARRFHHGAMVEIEEIRRRVKDAIGSDPFLSLNVCRRAGLPEDTFL